MNQQQLDLLAGMLVFIAIILAIALLITILFLLNLHRTLNEVSESNREMSPGMVWLSLIPLFSIVWNIIMVGKIANSLEKEFRDREWSTSNEGFGRTSGMIWAWGGVANLVLSLMQNAAQFADAGPVAMMFGLIGCPLGLAIFISWIMFWVQTHQYKVRLREGGRGYRSGSIEEDYDDEPRPRRTEEDFDRYEGKDRKDRDEKDREDY